MEPTIPDFGIPPTPHVLEMPDNSAFYSPAQSQSVRQQDGVESSVNLVQDCSRAFISISHCQGEKSTGTLDDTFEVAD